MTTQPDGVTAEIFTGTVADAQFSADGTRAFVASGNAVRVIDVASGATIKTFALAHAAGALDVSADGRFVAVVDTAAPGAFYQIALGTGRITHVVLPQADGYTAVLRDVAWAADGSLLLTQQGGSWIARYDPATGTASAVTSDGARQDATLVRNDDHTVIYAIDHSIFQVSDIYTSGTGLTATRVASPDPYAGASVPYPMIPSGAVSPDGKTVFEAAGTTLRNGALAAVGTISEGYAQFVGAAYSKDGQHLYLLDGTGTISDYHTADGTVAAWYEFALTPPEFASQFGQGRPCYGNLLSVSDDGHTLLAVTTTGLERIDLATAVPTATAGDDTLRSSIDGATTNGRLLGLAGNDTMTIDGYAYAMGGKGDDTYIVEAAGDGTIVERPGEGIDTVRFATARVSFEGDIENFIYTGTDAITIGGNALDNHIVTGPGDDVIVASAGTDVIDGGAGTDTLDFSELSEAYTSGVHVDLRIAGAQGVGALGTETLSGIENLTGSGFADSLHGNGAANVLIGGYGSDVLDGGAGADTLIGGYGSDTYIVDNAHDTVSEDGRNGFDADGYDTVRSSVSFVLPAFVERLELQGTANINGSGGWDDNTIIGNAGANRLDGTTGNDTLRGGAGNDLLIGGPGPSQAWPMPTDNDTLDGGRGFDTVSYAATGAGVRVSLAVTAPQETGGSGTDTLVSIEGLVGTMFADMLTGSDGANRIEGRAGDDVIEGGGGNDVLIGGAGTDTASYAGAHDGVTVDLAITAAQDTGGAGIDRLSGFENLTGGTGADVLSGSDAANAISGGAGNDTLAGRGGADVLDGGAGDDTMIGGAGNDSYVVDSSHDQVIETASGRPGDTQDAGGIDTVLASASFALDGPGAQFVERLTLTGNGAIDGTGNALDNTITGNDAANRLDGGAGADTMAGHGGNDTYVVDNAGDTVIETAADGGVDTVESSIAFTLDTAALVHVENLTLTGHAAIDGTGNALDNTIIGNDAANRLSGGRGTDVLTGGAGVDTFVFAPAHTGATAATADTITDFVHGTDRIDLSAIDADATSAGSNEAFAFIGNAAFHHVAGELRFSGHGADTLIEGDRNGDGVAEIAILLTGAVTLTGADFVL